MRRIAFMLFAILLTLAACKKDDETTRCEQLEGQWTCQSWMEDDEQFFGSANFILASTFTFEPLAEGQGDFTWMIDYALGGSETVIGMYVPNSNCDAVTITPKGGASSTYDFSFEGSVLVLSGLIGNAEVVMKFTME